MTTTVLRSRVWSDESDELSSQRTGVVLSFIDVFVGAAPTRPPGVELLIEQTVLERWDEPVMIGGSEVKEFVPTGLRSNVTLSANVTFAALERRTPRSAPPAPRRYRIAVDGAGVIARDYPLVLPGLPLRTGGLDFDFSSADATVTLRQLLLYPAPDYRFPSHVPILRGTYAGHLRATPLLLRAISAGSGGTPSALGTDQAMTSYAYFGRRVPDAGSSPAARTLPFSIGLRRGRRPVLIEVVDPLTGVVIAAKPPPASVTDLLVIP